MKIITYDAIGLSSQGEDVNFWNPGCNRLLEDEITAAQFPATTNLIRGMSWQCGTISEVPDFCAILSQLGENRAWINRNRDIGSPGYSRYSSNPWGLYDMHANVREWVADCYDHICDWEDPHWVHRGGAYNGPARTCRSADRSHNTPDNGNLYHVGFRVVLVYNR